MIPKKISHFKKKKKSCIYILKRFPWLKPIFFVIGCRFFCQKFKTNANIFSFGLHVNKSYIKTKGGIFFGDFQ